jgi:hypothetical protein
MALICERVLQESDGGLSIIRVIDRFTHTITGVDALPRAAASSGLAGVDPCR